MLKFYGSDFCSTCRAAHGLLEAQGITAEYIDITASNPNLRAFLALRDSRPEYEEIKKEGLIGIPTFLWEDGSIELGLDWLKSAGSCADC